MEVLPEMISLFERLKEATDTVEELRILDAIYEAMPHRNFSSHVFQYAPERLAVMEMTDVFWSDWGTPTRIVDTVGKIGKSRIFVDEPKTLAGVERMRHVGKDTQIFGRVMPATHIQLKSAAGWLFSNPHQRQE